MSSGFGVDTQQRVNGIWEHKSIGHAARLEVFLAIETGLALFCGWWTTIRDRVSSSILVCDRY